MQFQHTPQFLVKTFKRHYRKVKSIAEKLAASGGSFSLAYSYDKEKGLQSKIVTPDDEMTIRLVVLMRRFLNPADMLFYKHILEALKDHFPRAVPDERVIKLVQTIDVVNKGSFSFIVNQQPITAENIYQRIADGNYFERDDEEAVTFLRNLSGTPAAHFALLEFYTYNWALFNVASMLFDMILVIERSEQYSQLFQEEISSDKRCIYCLSDLGSFSSEEHIVPESLGNYDTVLDKGMVCDPCNNEVLSRLDQELVHADFVAFLKTLYMPYTKEGKLPQAIYPNLTIRKTHPNHIEIKSNSKKNLRFGEPDENGIFEFSITMTGRKQFDAKLIGRALYKIGLGMVAFHEGKEVACQSQYDAARTFILKGEDFPNYLVVSNQTKPHPLITSHYDRVWGGTGFQLDIYGLLFLFNLEATPVIELTEEQLAEIDFSSFPLFEAKETHSPTI